MIINTNVSSLLTQNYLNKTQGNLSKNMEKLSSGSRINTAADDAAGLAIATRMTSQINGKGVASRNVGDGISMIQTAESALGSVTNILQRMRDLSVQADNGTYGATDAQAMDNEFNQLKAEIGNIAGKTSFNGNNLLDGSKPSISIHTGDGSIDTLAVNLYDINTASLGVENALSPGTVVGGQSLDDAHLASGTDPVTSLPYSGAPQSAITIIDGAIDWVSKMRAELGATQNRLNFTLDNLSSSSINLSSARSRIQDTDMASEMSEMTKNKILSQSSMAMLSQANQQPQAILQLLQGQ